MEQRFFANGYIFEHKSLVDIVLFHELLTANVFLEGACTTDILAKNPKMSRWYTEMGTGIDFLLAEEFAAEYRCKPI